MTDFYVGFGILIGIHLTVAYVIVPAQYALLQMNETKKTTK